MPSASLGLVTSPLPIPWVVRALLSLCQAILWCPAVPRWTLLTTHVCPAGTHTLWRRQGPGHPVEPDQEGVDQPGAALPAQVHLAQGQGLQAGGERHGLAVCPGGGPTHQCGGGR